MKVSKNQIQNVSFSSSKEEVRPQQNQPSIQGGEEEMENSLKCLAAQVPVVPKNSFVKQKANLAERLKILNTTTALHREYCSKDDERFGKDGIKSILDAVDTIEKLNIVNEQLDILEDNENPKSNNVWTGTILALINPKSEKEEIFEQTSIKPTTIEPTTIEPTTIVPTISLSPVEAEPMVPEGLTEDQAKVLKLEEKLMRIYSDNTLPVANWEAICDIMKLAINDPSKVSFINSLLDEVEKETPERKRIMSFWAKNIAEQTVIEFGIPEGIKLSCLEFPITPELEDMLKK